MLKKLKNNQFLFEELVKRDFKKKYKRTALGMVWSVLSPLFMLLVMALVFTQFFAGTTEHYIIYLFAGQIVFSYFTDATNEGMNSLVGNADIFTKVNVPKYLFLLSKNVSALINFGLILLIFFGFIAADSTLHFTWKYIFLFFPIICLIVFNLGVGLILSALFIFFKDIEYLYRVLIQLLMYLSAIFYNIEAFPLKIQYLFYLNPIYVCIRYFRKIVIESDIPEPAFHLLLAFYALAVFGVGCWMYKKYNHKFLYYV
mgnify:FL=1